MNKPTFKDVVGIQWPIAIMAMNRVSDVKLAVAGAQAGILPSLSIFNYYVVPATVDVQRARAAIDEFKTLSNNAPILLSISVDTLINDQSFELLLDTRVKVIELVLDSPAENTITEERNALRDSRIAQLRSLNVIVLQKALNVADIEEVDMDGFILKGPGGAGRVVEDGDNLIDRIKQCRALYPNKYIIANGGVGTPAQLKECLDAGADAVGLGTIFAAAEECAISTETKLKMVEATATDIKKLNRGAQQQALVFKELTKDVYNNTRGLAEGIRNPESGHVFAGSGIDSITAIKPVKQIVEELTKDIV